MKILFICGSLETGKDGVGDYTRRLSSELIKLGNEAQIIALNDKYIYSLWQGFQSDEIIDIKVTRLSSLERFRNRTKAAKNIVRIFQPHFISLQYVPYSFQKRGLPFGIAMILKKIGGNVKWHIMFHELWIGIKKDSPFSHFIYKSMQQNIVKKLNKQLSPICNHTNNIVFQLELKRENINSTILSLFSNIRFFPITDEAKDKLFATLHIDNRERNSYFLIAIFGGIHHIKEVAQAVKKNIDNAKQNCQLPFLLFFGKSGLTKDVIINEFSELQVQIYFFGEVAEKLASHLMQIADIAISCTAEEYTGKSGIYAALKAHSLPVKQSSHINIPQYTSAIQNFNIYLEEKPATEWQVTFVAKQFLNDLSLHSNL